MINYVTGYQDTTGGAVTVSMRAQKSEIISGRPNINAVYVHTGERVLIRFERQTRNYGAIDVRGITYYTDREGVLIYDATDELRAAMADGGYVDLLVQIALRLYPLAGVSPEYAQLPRPTMIPADSVTSGAQCTPPMVVLQHPILGKFYDLVFEYYGDWAEGCDWQARAANGDTQQPYSSGDPITNAMTLNAAADYMIDLSADDSPMKIRFDVLPECESACVLRWLSVTGIYKQAIWRVKKIQRKATSVDLLPIGDNYKRERGNDTEFVAYIEGLDAYSYAYYADLITSADVHCAMRIGEFITREETRVAIGTNNYTIPDGNCGELQTLEVTIKYKHYDEV